MDIRQLLAYQIICNDRKDRHQSSSRSIIWPHRRWRTDKEEVEERAPQVDVISVGNSEGGQGGATTLQAESKEPGFRKHSSEVSQINITGIISTVTVTTLSKV
ncbi:hypothetical protein EJB05_27655, partial [Eragrostis curvula]